MKITNLSVLLVLVSLLSHGQTFTECASEYNVKFKKISLDRATKKVESHKADSLLNDVVAVYEACIIGKTLPEFDLISVSGKRHTSEDLKGKAVVLNIWTLSCGHCIQEIPVLNKIDSEYRDNKDLVFISMLLEKPEDLTKFQERKGSLMQNRSILQVEFEVIANPLLFGSISMRKSLEAPTNLFIDKNGRIVKKTTGAPQDPTQHETKLRSEIDALLKL